MKLGRRKRFVSSRKYMGVFAVCAIGVFVVFQWLLCSCMYVCICIGCVEGEDVEMSKCWNDEMVFVCCLKTILLIVEDIFLLVEVFFYAAVSTMMAQLSFFVFGKFSFLRFFYLVIYRRSSASPCPHAHHAGPPASTRSFHLLRSTKRTSSTSYILRTPYCSLASSTS